MAKIPIQRSTTIPPSVGPTTRASLDTRTGGVGVGQALAGFGAVLGDIGFDILTKMRQAEDAVELSSMKRQNDEIMNAGLQEAAKLQDEDEALKIWNNAKVRAGEIKSKRDNVNTAFTVHVNNAALRWDRAFATQTLATKKRNIIADAETNIQSSLEKGDIDEAAKSYAILKASNLIAPATFDKAIDELPVNAILAQATVVANTDPDKALEMLVQIEDPTAEQVIRKDNLIGRINSIKNRNRSALKTQQDEERLGLYEHAYVLNEPLTFALTRELAPSLPAKESIAFFDDWKDAQEEKVEQGVSKIEEGDAGILASIQASIDLAPEKWTEDAIYRATKQWPDQNGKFQSKIVLGTKHAPGLVTRLKRNQKVDVDPAFKRLTTALSQMRSAGLFGDTDEVDTAKTYLRLTRNLEVFLETKPSAGEAEAFFEKLIEEDVRTFGFLGSNQLPGLDDSSLRLDFRGRQFDVWFGDVIFIGNETFQLVGRKAGKPIFEKR